MAQFVVSGLSVLWRKGVKMSESERLDGFKEESERMGLDDKLAALPGARIGQIEGREAVLIKIESRLHEIFSGYAFTTAESVRLEAVFQQVLSFRTRMKDGHLKAGTAELKSMDEICKLHIIKVGNACHWHLSEVAKVLKIGRSTLYRYMKS